MFTLKSATILALVGSAFAAPLAHRGEWDGPKGRLPGAFGYDSDKTIVVIPTNTNSQDATTTTEVATTTTTVVVVADSSDDNDTTSGNTGGSYFGGKGNSGSNTGSSSGSNSGSSTGSTNTGSTSTGSSSGTGYMAIVSKWRAAGGLSALTQSSKLEANAMKTAVDGNGQMKHELNPGSFAQVLAPGTASNFEHVYVGGWLCEKPSLPGLSGVCATQSQGWSHDSTGHADILTDKKYTQIGCALADGIWACDLA